MTALRPVRFVTIILPTILDFEIQFFASPVAADEQLAGVLSPMSGGAASCSRRADLSNPWDYQAKMNCRTFTSTMDDSGRDSEGYNVVGEVGGG